MYQYSEEDRELIAAARKKNKDKYSTLTQRRVRHFRFASTIPMTPLTLTAKLTTRLSSDVQRKYTPHAETAGAQSHPA